MEALNKRVEELAKELKRTEERAKRRERAIRKQIEEMRGPSGKGRVTKRKPRT